MSLCEPKLESKPEITDFPIFKTQIPPNANKLPVSFIHGVRKLWKMFDEMRPSEDVFASWFGLTVAKMGQDG